jgi:hypothetical protein
MAAAPTELVSMAVVSVGADSVEGALTAVVSMEAALLVADSAAEALLVAVAVVGIASRRQPAWSVYVPVAARGVMPPNRASSKTLK